MPERRRPPVPRAVPPPAGTTPGEAFDAPRRADAHPARPDGCPWDREQTLDSLQAVRARGSARGGRRHRAPRPRRAAGRDRRPHLRRRVPRAAVRRRPATSPSPTRCTTSAPSWSGAIRTCSRRDAGTADVTTPDAVQGHSGKQIKAAERAEKGRARRGAVRRHPEDAAGAARAPTRSARARPRSASTGRRPSEVLEKVDEEVGELREALGRRRSRRSRRRDRRPAVRGRQPGAQARASSPKRRCAPPTASSCGASRGRGAPLADGLRLDDATLDQMEAAWQAAKRAESARR